MKKIWHVMLSALIVLPLILGSFGASVSAATTDPALEKIQKKGTLVVGLSADYAPYEFHKTLKGSEYKDAGVIASGDDHIVGFDVSLAQTVAKQLGVKLQIKELGFDALLGAMKTGKIDMIISGMSDTPEREKEVDFSKPYLTAPQTMLIQKKDASKYTTNLSTWKGAKIAAQKQTIQEQAAQGVSGAQTVSLQKFTDEILQLSQGTVQGVVAEEPIAKAYAQQNKALEVIYPKFSIDAGASAIAMPKNSPALQAQVNEVVSKVTTNGQLKEWQKEAGALMFVGKNESFWSKYGHYFISGTWITLLLAFIAVIMGAILGTLLALMKLSKNWILKIISNVYIEFLRGTPLLVQVFLVFFGSQVFGLGLDAFASGALAMGLNSGAYVAEIVRSGINSVDNGQTEAARSLGLSPKKTMQKVVLPQAVKTILPALGNEFVTVIKESSVISVVGVGELMFQAGVVQGASFKPFLPLVIVSLIYFVLTFGLSRILNKIEKVWA
ncbi:MAG TPA: ABC transporter substrate-binding protein/permease [Lactobacillaceae bacterium]|jgi:polar amino acid transport system substrate-binding protein